jgi:flagellar biosynthetic protein FlhB
LIVAIDVPFQLWDHSSKLKMTKEEVRQENKESEGSPEVKGQIRRMQREMARRRMMAEVPKADVIVTNPTHYAVALRYQDKLMGAPVIVAKGSALIALRIRGLGEEHHIPILEAPPLARALFRHGELGEEIPAALYTAVAEVLAYVYQLRSYEAGEGIAPQPPRSLPVPPGLDPESEIA